MVKGISRQVIVVNSPDQQLFEQAIFILRDGHKSVTDDALLREAKRLLHANRGVKTKSQDLVGPLWAVGGAVVTGLVWLVTVLL